jgi:hypothetical protein
VQTTQQQATAQDTKKCIKRIRSRLERWELTHLRELAASLHEQLEDAELRASMAEHQADMFQDMCMGLQDELQRDGKRLGLTIDGRVIALQSRTICDDFGDLVQVAA